MKKNTFYQIDGVNEVFNTLKNAKWHIYVAYTDKERAKYLPASSCIYKVVNGEVTTYTPFTVDDNGKYKFSKTVKY